MASIPTQRTNAELKKRGWPCYTVEKFIPMAKGGFKKDCWGADIIALDGQPGSLLIQTTSGANHAARRKKVLGIPEARLWLEAGNRFDIWTWSKRGKEGKRKLWTLREESLSLDMFPSAPG